MWAGDRATLRPSGHPRLLIQATRHLGIVPSNYCFSRSVSLLADGVNAWAAGEGRGKLISFQLLAEEVWPPETENYSGPMTFVPGR